MDFKNGLKLKVKEKRKLVMGLSQIFQRIGFKTFSGRFRTLDGSDYEFAINQLSDTKLYPDPNPYKSTFDRF